MRIFVIFALACLPIWGTTWPAATCGSSDVQSALNKVAADGDIVTIPSGTCTWTTQVTYTGSHSVSIIGAGSQTTVGGGDVTVIIDNINRSGTDPSSFSISTASGKTVRLCCITMEITNSSNYTDNGTLRITGNGDYTDLVRVDHFHIANLRRQGVSTYGLYGVFDHDLFDMSSGSLDNALRPLGVFATWGDPEWAANTSFGSSSFTYVEDSTFNNGVVNDCVDGGRQVFRHNTMNNASVQTHPTGSQGRARGCRAMEIYDNTFNGGSCSPNCFNVDFLSSGPELIWGNGSGSSYQNFMTIHSMRRDNETYGQTATPAGWGYCGTSAGSGGTDSGTGSNWDQNVVPSNGYACMDQPGRGKGDRLVNDFSTTQNQTTGTIAWPNQGLEPVYEWLDTWAGSGGGSFWAIYDTPSLANNQDFYFQCGSNNTSCASFTGAAGTGSGLLSARPATCTVQVGYWATDTNTLYLCESTNTWTSYYTPYTYPHPLTGGGSILSGPMAISGMVMGGMAH